MDGDCGDLLKKIPSATQDKLDSASDNWNMDDWAKDNAEYQHQMESRKKHDFTHCLTRTQ